MAEVRQLRYFVAVAERLSFSHAALDLAISQPSISEAVRKLEMELGVQLLRRTSRRVALTEAGNALLPEARVAIDSFDAALDVARGYGSGPSGPLRVGYEVAGAWRLNTRARARFSRLLPQVRVEPRRFEWGEEVTALREHECDVAFAWLPADISGLHAEVVAEEERFAGLSSDHPLAERSSLSILELNDEPITWTRRAPRGWGDWWTVSPRPDGSEPRWGPEYQDIQSMLEQVFSGRAYCIVPRSTTEFYARSDIAWVPLHDVEHLKIALAWREDDVSPVVTAFAEVVREVASG